MFQNQLLRIAPLPVEGTVIASQQCSPRIEVILGGSGVTNWTARSSMGGTIFHFPNARDLKRVQGQVLNDAVANAYSVEIRYKTLLPAFNSQSVVP